MLTSLSGIADVAESYARRQTNDTQGNLGWPGREPWLAPWGEMHEEADDAMREARDTRAKSSSVGCRRHTSYSPTSYFVGQRPRRMHYGARPGPPTTGVRSMVFPSRLRRFSQATFFNGGSFCRRCSRHSKKRRTSHAAKVGSRLRNVRSSSS